MRPVADPIHQAKRYIVQRVFIEMVFDQNMRTAYAAGLGEERGNIGGVMQNIDKHANVKKGIGKRELEPVIGDTRNLAVRAHQEFDSLNGNIRAKAGDQTGNSAVTATDVQNRGALGNLAGQQIRKDLSAAFENERFVPAADPG